MKDMRNILLKYPIIYNSNDELSFIKDIYFPIYDSNNNENYMKTFYYLIKDLYINVKDMRKVYNGLNIYGKQI